MSATFDGIPVESCHEVKSTPRGTRYPERVAWVVLASVIPGFGRQGLVRMSDVKIKESR